MLISRVARIFRTHSCSNRASPDVQPESSMIESIVPNRIVWIPGSDPDSPEAQRAGECFFQLMLNTRLWMHRRVDSLRLDDGLQTRRHVSYDFTLPTEWSVLESNGRVLVPITLMAKGTLKRLDTAPIGGRASAVLTSDQNRECSLWMLLAASRWLLPEDIDRSKLSRALQQFLSLETKRADRYFELVNLWLKSHLGVRAETDDYILFMLWTESFVTSFLFLVSLDSSTINDRAVLKFSFDQDSPFALHRSSEVEIQQAVETLGDVASQHIEIRLPPSVQVKSFKLVEDGELREEIKCTSRHPKQIVHCAISTNPDSYAARWHLSIAPASQSLYRFTIISVSAVAFLVVFGSIIRIYDLPIVHWTPTTLPSPASSILLVGPALLLSWLGRGGEHELVGRILEPLRSMLTLTSASLVVMAVLAAVPLQNIAWNTGWVISAALALSSWSWLIAYMVRPSWRRQRASFASHLEKRRLARTTPSQ